MTPKNPMSEEKHNMCCGRGNAAKNTSAFNGRPVKPIPLGSMYRVQFCRRDMLISYVAFSFQKLEGDKYKVFLNGQTCVMNREGLKGLKIPKVDLKDI